MLLFIKRKGMFLDREVKPTMKAVSTLREMLGECGLRYVRMFIVTLKGRLHVTLF